MSPRSNREPALGQQSTLIKHVISINHILEPAIWSHDTGQRITWFNRCQLIIKWCHLSKPRLHVSVNLLFGARPPCCATPPSSPSSSCAPASNTASHDNHEKINSWVSFTFYGYRAPLGGLRPPELRYYTSPLWASRRDHPWGPDLPGGPGGQKHEFSTDSHPDATLGSFFW